MTDLGPNKRRMAQLLRMLSSGGGERRNAFAALERLMRSEGISWTDIGNVIDGSGEYSEAEMQELAQTIRAEAFADGLRVGTARASHNNNENITLPKPGDMAKFCRDRLSQLKDDRQREFVNDMFLITQHHRSLSPGRLGYLASIYIQVGGKI